MKAVSVTELKAHLSKYLRQVRRGGEVQVLDRGVPVARLVGLPSVRDDDRARIERLVRAGALRPARGDASWLLAEEPLEAPQADVSGALREDREDRT
jgi:prevent-host-death family protein